MLASSTTPSPNTNTPSSRSVNRLLNTLRDEHIRHARNQQSGRHTSVQLPRRPIGLKGPTLPVAYGLAQLEVEANARRSVYELSAPPSTIATRRSGASFRTVAQRSAALEPLFTNLNPHARTPSLEESASSLVQLCLRILLVQYTVEDLVPFLDDYLATLFLRHAITHTPAAAFALQNILLDDNLFGGEGYVIGDQGDLLTRIIERSRSLIQRNTPGEVPNNENWDDDESIEDGASAQSGIRILTIVQMPLSNPTFFSLPRTLIHLALLALPTAVSVHRVFDICPQLKFLDLSFNPWLETKILERVRWDNCFALEILVVRECPASQDASELVNQMRTNPVHVVTE